MSAVRWFVWKGALVGAAWAWMSATALADESAPSAATPADSAASTSAPRPPPLLDDLELPERTHERRLELGVRALLVSRLAEREIDGQLTGVDYGVSPGIGAIFRVPVLEHLSVAGAWGLSSLESKIEPGALAITRRPSDPAEPIDSLGGLTWWMQARVEPTLQFSSLLRGWLVLGVGWGRYELEPVHVRDSSGTFLVRDRSASYVDFPLGIGGSVALVDDWLSLELELLASPTLSTDGSAFTTVGVVDGAGEASAVGPLPRAPVSLQPSLGLTVIL